MLRRWNADRDGQQQLLALVQERWEAAYAGPLAPHTYLHQPQVRGAGPAAAAAAVRACSFPGSMNLRNAHDAMLQRPAAGSARSTLPPPHSPPPAAQGRLTLDLHGYSAWTAQLAVLSTLRGLLRQHRTQGRISDQLSRLDIITGRGNRR